MITWNVTKSATDVSLEPFKVWCDVLLYNSCPIDCIGKDQIQMEEVVWQIRTVSGLSQDSPLPRIRHYPIYTKVRSHIGHRVILRDLVSLADTLTL